MYDDDLSSLEDGLRRLKVEYDIFFNGSRKRPPDDLRARVDRIVKKLAEVQDMSYAERFRYTTLVGRFYVYRDLWRRTIMEMESDEEAPEKVAAINALKHTDARPEPAPESIRIVIADATAEEDKVRALYDTLLQWQGKQAGRKPAISFSQFSNYIAAQTQGIRGKFNCSKVAFRISLVDDAVKFTAAAEDEDQSTCGD